MEKERTRVAGEYDPPKPIHHFVWMALTVLAIMTAYESLRQILFPDTVVRLSQIIINFLASITAASASCLTFNKLRSVYKRNLKEVAKRRRLESELKKRLAFGDLVIRIVSEFAGIDERNIESAIQSALETVGEFTGSDRAYVFQFKADGSLVDNTHEWCAKEVKPQIQRLQSIPFFEELPWLARHLLEDGTVYLNDVANLPPEAWRERDHFEVQNIHSVLLVPMKVNGDLIGFLGFDATRETRSWKKEDVKLLQLLGDTLCQVLDRHQALKENEQLQTRLANAIEIARLGPWEYDVENDRFLFNDYFYKMFRTTVEEVGGYAIPSQEYARRFLHPDDVPIVSEEVRNAAEATDPRYCRQIDHRVVFGDGEIGYISVRFFVVKDEKGRTIKTYGVNQDITDRRQAEQQLRYQAGLLASVSDAIISTDMEFHIRSWNPAAETIYGFSAAEVLGRKLDAIVSSEYADASPEEVVRQLFREGRWTGEATQKAKDGAQRFVLSSVSLVYDEIGKPSGIVTVNHDLTTSKILKTRKEELKRQFHQAQKMESIGRLASGVAHDFNNTLSVILGNADLALVQLNPESPFHEEFQEISAAARQSLGLTRQLLTLARKEDIYPVVMDLNSTVGESLRMLRRLMGEDIQLDWLPAPELKRVRVDPAQINQILTNLCVNARDAIANVGKVTIGTRMAFPDLDCCRENPDFEPVQYVELFVNDDGCGMDKETLEHVFEPFFTTKEAGKGTGLGLATVYGIVKQNGGFIDVDSKPGKGTRFKIYLPSCESSTVEIRQSAPENIKPGNAETLLVVEDDPAILKLIVRFLEPLGYGILTAENPRDALRLETSRIEAIDLLVTDVVLPEMNGKELADRLTERNPNLRTLFMSGYSSEFMADRGVLDLETNFLPKPFTRNNLAAKIRATLDSAAFEAPVSC